MLKRFALLLLSIPLGTAAAAAGPGEEAGALVDRWSSTYSANDRNALAQLYAPDAIQLGTTEPVAAKGRDAIRAYLAPLDSGGRRNEIREKHIIVLGDGAVLVTGFYDFSRKEQSFGSWW